MRAVRRRAPRVPFPADRLGPGREAPPRPAKPPAVCIGRDKRPYTGAPR